MTDFDATRAFFDLPEGVIYLDGNSLGPLPRHVPERLQAVLTEEWGRQLIRGWNEAGWMAAPRRVGDRVGRLVGAEPGHVMMGDTLSIKVYQALAAAVRMRPERSVILSDTGNFPSDLYMAEGLIGLLGGSLELRLVEPEAVEAALSEEVAVLMLTEVDYRTGRLHDMARLTAAAHGVGALTVWDLAHSAGALPVDLAGAGADFAVGCTYKYLNGGPGAPAFVYVAPRHADRAEPALAGWLGHEEPFAFDLDYRAARGIERMRVGTPPILQLASLDAALDVWDLADLEDVRARSMALGDLLVERIEATCPELGLRSPRDATSRGSQVAFRHPEGYAVMRALVDRGVIGDFRAPDNLRFGICPLYLGESDILGAVEILAEVLERRLWDQERYRTRAPVT